LGRSRREEREPGRARIPADWAETMGGIVQTTTGDGGLPAYDLTDAELGPGSSLGNGHVWVTVGTDGRIHTFFSIDVGEEVAGPLMVRYGSAETRIAGRPGAFAEAANVPLAPVRPGRFVIHPAYQKHIFDLAGAISVQETVLVPRGETVESGDETAVYYFVELENRADEPRALRVYAFARFAGSRRTPVIRGHSDERAGALFASEEENPDWIRVLAATRGPTSWAITNDFGPIYDTDFMPSLNSETRAEGDVLGCLELRVELAPRAQERFAFVLSFTPDGLEAAHSQLDRLLDADAMLDSTVAYVEEELAPCQVMTPDPVINEGVLWAKVNMDRVLAHFPQGESFTNEPGVSSNVVARDAVWFVYGCDHFRPETSRRLLDALVKFQYPTGKIPEYFNARTGDVDDYGLNINDGTPLFVLGVNHHVRSTGDLDYLRSVYDSVARAARYIMSQRDARGLVYCGAEGVEVWGICSWRNVIPNYRINGAVTEVNAECAAALRAMGHMAENLGRTGDAEEFSNASRELAAAINGHLLDKGRQLYLLNIDTEGRRHTDVTADELFPVLFRIADEDVAFRIIRRLNSPDFWTAAGLRTVSRADPLYDPAKHVGLLGGVWPGVTWWYAFAAARYHPEFMVKALHASYEHYNRHPRVFGTVPGHFSEWFDGESLMNRGMRLSPWEPPRFLWAAVEGICGIMVSPGEPGIRPLLPPDWKWASAMGVCYHGGRITAFAGRMGERVHVWANTEFKSTGTKDVFDDDVTDRVAVGHAGAHPVALQGRRRTIVAIGSCHDQALTTPVGLAELLDADQVYRVRQYSSERGEWCLEETARGSALANLGLRIEAKGYHVLEFTKAASLK
jgi:glycogen debranching enzyme